MRQPSGWPAERGNVAGLTGLPSQATAALSPVLAGYLFECPALSMPFEIGALVQGAGTALSYLFFRNAHPPEELACHAAEPVVAAAAPR